MLITRIRFTATCRSDMWQSNPWPDWLARRHLLCFVYRAKSARSNIELHRLRKDQNVPPTDAIFRVKQIAKSHQLWSRTLVYPQGSYGSLKSMKVQDILAVKIMYLKVLNFQETVEKSIKVHIKRVLLLINNYVCYFADASFEAIVCKKIFCGGKSHSCRRRPIILPASRSFPANRSIG